jgi:hypothetical protein
MDEYEKRRRSRIQAAYRRLGTSTPACSICGEDNPFCLERHEPGGRKHSNLYIIICRNCHRKLEDDRRDHFSPIWTTPEPVESLSKALQGEADLFERLAKKRREDARMLHELSRRDIIEPDGDDK